MPDDTRPTQPLAEAETPSVVHRPAPHDSAPKHVTGTAQYIDDLPEPAGTLVTHLHLAPVAAGRIDRLDLTAVRAAPGVAAALGAAEIPGHNTIAPVADDEPIFPVDTIAFHSQPVFAVYAEDSASARAAAEQADLAITETPPILGIDAARAADTKVQDPYTMARGAAAEALAAAPQRLDGELRIGGQEHFYLEGQIALAVPGEDGGMTVYSSTQHPSEGQHLIAAALGVPEARVTVEVRRMGGAFGGKESQASLCAVIAALGASATGRPVKLRLDRDVDMMITGKRHDFLAQYSLGHDAQGRLLAYDVSFAANCGHSLDLSAGVVDRAMFHADNAYYLPNVAIIAHRCRTHQVSNTAFRGFGGPQGMLPIEMALDRIAHRVGRDPLDVRLDNCYGGPGRDMTPYHMTVEDNLAPAVMRDLAERADYRARRAAIEADNRRAAHWKRGIALTPVKFGISFTLTHLNQAGALVHVYTDGSVQLNHGGTEMGQGLFIKIAQVVAETFGIPLDWVRPTATRTDKVPNTGPTAASSGSDLNGYAAQAAAETIKGRLAALFAERHGVPASSVRFADGQLHGGGVSVPFGTMAQAAFRQRIALSAAGFYKTPKITWDRASGRGRPFFYFAYGAAVSEVAIDGDTGEYRLERVDILHDVGRSLNPAIDRGQIEGGYIQGLGWLTSEELVFDDRGRLRTHAPSTYKIPTANDRPDAFHIHRVDAANPEPNLYRSKAVGEPPLMLAISALSAIHHAVSAFHDGAIWPVIDTPATPERVLAAIETPPAALAAASTPRTHELSDA